MYRVVPQVVDVSLGCKADKMVFREGIGDGAVEVASQNLWNLSGRQIEGEM